MSHIGQFQTAQSARRETRVGHSMILIVGIFLFILCSLVDTVSCRSFSENTFEKEEQQTHHKGQQQWNEDDAANDWQLSTDNVDFYKILHRLDLEEMITFLENASQVSDMGLTVQNPIARRRRRSRTIFGNDDRKQVITSRDINVMPYSATVRISPTGCTGTLIGPKHVLTAAHCAYRGTEKRTKTKLKVGFVNSYSRTRWRKVRKVYAPREWHTITKRRERSRHDYAVLELRREHKQQYMTPVAYHRSQGSELRFNGFPADKKSNTMWNTRCTVKQIWHGFLMNPCDITKGMSGAGSYYLQAKNKKYAVRGVAIATIKFRKPHERRVYRTNVANPLTRQKANTICRWMRAGPDCRSFK